jgi:hypothetical protein
MCPHTIENVQASDMDADLAIDTIKREMVRMLDPAVAEIPNPRYELAAYIKEHGHHPYAKLSKETRASIERSYLGSWYGQFVDSEFSCPEAFGSHDGLVQKYITAAICEYLRIEGVCVS